MGNDYPLLFLKEPIEFYNYQILLQNLGYLKPITTGSFELTLSAWDRYDKLRQNAIISDQAFVAMWFDPSLQGIWENGIKPALEECGYKPLRIDMQEHNEKICDRIIAELKKSSLVIAEFTGQRGGVYFEAGYALGLGKKVIWCCRENEIEKVHFDTRQYNHITWNTSDELKEKLINRIKATIL